MSSGSQILKIALIYLSLGYYFTASLLKIIDVFNIEARQKFNGKQSFFWAQKYACIVFQIQRKIYFN